MDMTSWLSYFSKGLVHQIKNVQEKGIQAMHIDAIASQYELSVRQQDICDLLMTKEAITLEECANEFVNIPSQSLRRDLSDMQRKGIVIISKAGKISIFRFSSAISNQPKE